jgi:hypothetical protein
MPGTEVWTVRTVGVSAIHDYNDSQFRNGRSHSEDQIKSVQLVVEALKGCTYMYLAHLLRVFSPCIYNDLWIGDESAANF